MVAVANELLDLVCEVFYGDGSITSLHIVYEVLLYMSAVTDMAVA